MRQRANQITHFRRGGLLSRETGCGRTIAGSMEIDNLHPRCPRCAAFARLVVLEDSWTNGNPSDALRAEIDSLRAVAEAA